MDTKPLLTVAEVSTFLNVRPGTNDARMKMLAEMATTSLQTATRRFFTRQTMTEYLTSRDNMRTDYDFRGSSDYAMPSVDFGGMKTIVDPQAVSLTGINVDPSSAQVWYNAFATGDASFNDDTKLDASQFQIDVSLDTSISRLHLYFGTRFRVRAIKAVYDSGYEAAPTPGKEDEVTLSASAPDWLKQAALIQCQFLNIKLRQDNIGMAAERTTSEKGKVSMSNFLVVNGVTPEALSFVGHLRQVVTGRR